MKQIIIIGLVAFTGFSSFAQEKKYDANGFEIGKAPITTSQNPSESISVSDNNLDVNGVDKSTMKAMPSDASVQSEVIINNQNVDADGRPTNAKVEDHIYKVKDVQEQSPTENQDYRKKGDVPVDYSNGVKETYTRKSNENNPVDYSNGVKENYVRDLSVKEPKMAEQAKIVIDPNAVNGSSQQSKSAQTTGSAANANATKTAPVNPAGPVLNKQSDNAANTKDVQQTPPVNPSK